MSIIDAIRHIPIC